MNKNDPLADIINENHRTQATTQSTQRAAKIIRSTQIKRAQSDFMEFGFVKIWTILLEFIAKLQASSTSQKLTTKQKTLKGDQHDL